MFTHATRTQATPDALATADEAEITNIELQLSADDLQSWEDTAQVANAAGHNYVVKFPATLELSDDLVQNCVKLCAALNCATLIIHEPMHRAFGARLTELAPGLALAVENNRFDKPRFQQWAQDTEALTLDVEHFWKFTLGDVTDETLLTELRDFLTEFGAKVRQVHLCGYSPDQPVHRPMYCNRDMAFAVLTLLDEHGFTGSVVSEVAPEYQNRRDLLMDAQLFASWKAQTTPAVA